MDHPSSFGPPSEHELTSLISQATANWNNADLKQQLASKIIGTFPTDIGSLDTMILVLTPSVDLAVIISSLVTRCLGNDGPSDSVSHLSIIDLISFLKEFVLPHLNENIKERVSEVFADAIWSIDSEIEAHKSSVEEQIKTIEAATLDQSSSMLINEGNTSIASSASLNLLALYRSKMEHLTDRHRQLIQLAQAMLEADLDGTAILQPAHCRLSWEYAFLHQTGLLPFTADLVAKQSTRLNTGLHYKQQRFNLLREESEGYSHLATELISAMGPAVTPLLIPHDSDNGDLTNYPHLRSILAPGESTPLLENRVEKVINNMKALIGFFDLDPNRTLDILLDVFCYNVTTHHPFFCFLIKKSHWLKAVDRSSPAVPRSQPGVPDGSLPPAHGSKLVASLLGFKFAHYQHNSDINATPDELYLMTAVLIWHKIIDLRDLLPHLTPDSDAIKQHEAEWRQDIANKATNAGPRNALSMAGALDGGGLSFSKSTAAKVPEPFPVSGSANPTVKTNQKSGLLSALLSIGAIQESIFILSLPNHQFLLYESPHQSFLLLRLIDVALSPAYINCGLSFSNTANQNSRSSNITQPKKRYLGGPGGIHQLLPPEYPKPVLSSQVRPRSTTSTISNARLENVFFWSEWRDRIPKASTQAEVLDLVWPLLRFVGPFGHTHTGVFHKIAELTAAAMQMQSPSYQPDVRWQCVLRWFLLPALSMMQGCVAASNVVWKVLRTFSYEDRYMIYGEWKERIYSRIPELKIQRARADAETKRVLKTMTLDNLKEKSRALAKLASSNPCIVFNAALNQVQTYDNLIACVIECLRYLNLFALDVLTYSIVEFLSNPDKDRSKSDGTNIAAWLQNLAKFVGNVFKRNLSLDPAVVLQYIANQLASGNAKDLIILRDIISKMGGVDVLQDLSVSQVVALGGSKTLRAEAVSPTTLVGKKPSVTKSSHRLMKALSESKLTVPLLVLVALQRQNAVLLAEDGAHLKYLGVLADSCQQVLFQFIEFLRHQLASRDVNEYEKVLPSMEVMWGQHGIDPAIIFQAWRPVLSASVRPPLKIGGDGEVIIEDGRQPDLPLPMNEGSASIVITAEGDSASDLGGAQCSEQDRYPNSLRPTVLLAEKMLPEPTRKLVGPHFFVTFWQLELYDIRMPDERYISETNRLNSMLADLDRDYASAMVSSQKEANRASRSKILEIRATLTKEMKIHIKHYELTRARLASEKSFWFPLSARSPFRAQLLEHIIQHCFNPRAKLSPVDAAYTAQFIKTLHGLGTASFMTLKLFDRIFSSDVGPTIFPCSEYEASNYGRFLKDLLLLVKSWYDSEAFFKKTGLGKDKKGNYLPGLRMKWGKVDSAGEGISESDMLSYDNLQKVVKKWTAIMSTVCKEAIQSGEYMHIRNSIAVLKELDGLVPLFEDQAIGLESAVTALLKSEKREDVKVLAYGYQSMLKRAAKNVIRTKPVNVPTSKKIETLAVPATTEAKPLDTSTDPSALLPTMQTKLATTPTTTCDPILSTSQSVPTASTPDPRHLHSHATGNGRPAGLPERPGLNPRSSQPPSRHDPDRKPNPPIRSSNGSTQLQRNSQDPDHIRATTSEISRPASAASSTLPSVEGAEREALARAAVQRSRKFANSPAFNAIPTPTGPASVKPLVQPPDESRGLVPSGPRSTRLTNAQAENTRIDELMRPPAIPSAPKAPKADSLRRDAVVYNSLNHHTNMPLHSSSSVLQAGITTSPRVREDHHKWLNEDNGGPRHRDDRRHGDDRESYDRREDRDHRRTREEPRTRAPSVESVRSIRSLRDKDRRGDRTERSEKRKRSRSPSERHRDHRERDRERERDRDRDRDRERERDKERDRKDRDKERETRHRDKDKDPSRGDEREREKRSHRRDRDKDDRRHDKERDKSRDSKVTNDILIDEATTKRRKVAVSVYSSPTIDTNSVSTSQQLDSRKALDSPRRSNVDERDPRENLNKADAKSMSSHYMASTIPSGPRALQPLLSSTPHVRPMPSGPASNENARSRFPNGPMDGPAKNDASSQNGKSDRIMDHTSQTTSTTPSSKSVPPPTHPRDMSNSSTPQSSTQSTRVSRESKLRDTKVHVGSLHGLASLTGVRHSGDLPSPLLAGKNNEPKKNISIKGMAASALQKANEDNARKEKKESDSDNIGAKSLSVDVDAASLRKRGRDREQSGAPPSAGTPTSLLSRMDDGRNFIPEDLGPKRKREVESGLEDVTKSDRRRSGQDDRPQDDARYHDSEQAGHQKPDSPGGNKTSSTENARGPRFSSRLNSNNAGQRNDREKMEKNGETVNRRKDRERGSSRDRHKRAFGRHQG